MSNGNGDYRDERMHRIIVYSLALITLCSVLALAACAICGFKEPQSLNIIAASGIGALAGLVPPSSRN